LEKFKIILKNHKVKASHREIVDIMKTFSVRELHAPNYDAVDKQQFIILFYPLEMLQIDLLDYTKYATKNKNYKFILIGIDIFSRKAFAEPIKAKTPRNVLEAFQNFDIMPTSVYHDSGNEFKGEFLLYLKDNDIMNVVSRIGNHHSLGVVDKFSRTLKTMISKVMTVNDTATYIDILKTLIDVYNRTPHSSLLDFSPNEVMRNSTVRNKILELNFEKLRYNKELIDAEKSKFSVGDDVRIKLKKKGFQKGYEQTYSSETYKVLGFNGNNIILDFDGEEKEFPSNEIKLSFSSHSGEGKEKSNLDQQARTRARLAREGIL
jgi:hypothetical protein